PVVGTVAGSSEGGATADGSDEAVLEGGDDGGGVSENGNGVDDFPIFVVSVVAGSSGGGVAADDGDEAVLEGGDNGGREGGRAGVYA
ncbi:hypothetical protein U1Q18_043134, partial [Sarracenia purpurea var. burkii]